MEAKPKLNLALSFRIKGTLNQPLGLLFYDPIYLKGESIISARNVRIPKHEVPTLPEMKKKIVTDMIESKINIQDVRSNSFRRFQIGATLAGYLENQYSGR